MAQFRGEVSGQSSTDAARVGNRESGLLTASDGQRLGVVVKMSWDKVLEDEVADIFLTTGQNGRVPARKHLGRFTRKDLPC